MATAEWVSMTMDSKDERFFKELGQRLAEARKAQGLTQVELAERLGVAQQTLAHYEVGRFRVPVALVIQMARELRFSLDDVLMGRSSAGKRGPASKLELQMEAVARLPKSKQRFVVDMIDAVLAQSQSV
jgi:transcriptional regulator with XRE-family HTH domain